MSSLRVRSVLIVAGSLLAVATLAACSGTAASTGTKSDIKLAGIMANSNDPYWISVMCGGTKEAKDKGVNLKWYTSGTTSAQTMQQNFDAASLTSPDGIYLNPFQAAQFATPVTKLMKSGVPVISSTPLDPAVQYDTTSIATDGKNFTDQFVKTLSPGAGSIVALGGITGIDVITQEWKPLEDAATSARSDISVLPTEYTDFDVTKTNQIVSSLLLAHPDLKMIIASTGPEGEGAAAAVKQAGKAGKVHIWAFDATPTEVGSLKDGVITVLAAKPAQAVGRAAIDELITAVTANPKKKALTAASPAAAALPVTIITKDNLDSAEAQAAIYKTTCD